MARDDSVPRVRARAAREVEIAAPPREASVVVVDLATRSLEKETSRFESAAGVNDGRVPHLEGRAHCIGDTGPPSCAISVLSIM